MRRELIFAGLAIVALASGCTRPTDDAETLAAIKGEAVALIRAHPTKMDAAVPKEDWPPTMARLKPKSISLGPEGVDILVKPHLDGGYGYYVLKTGQQLPGPKERYSRLVEGIYWYRPY